MPTFVPMEPSGRVLTASVSSMRALMAAFITKNAITAERAATAFSFFGHTDGHSYGEKQGKVVKHHRAAVVEHGQQGMKNCPLTKD